MREITVKPWPKCQDLDVWRSNVCSGRLCRFRWPRHGSRGETWLAPAQLPDPDYTLLSDSGDFDSNLLDSKLSIALQNMVDAAGEIAYEVKVKIRQRSQELGKKGKFPDGHRDFCHGS